ncbi:ester cyclase [Ktedonosporobacter rubrisoli]|uniref:Ester cyclase n=1 Tax=Ktedonosporobacter rubrisoli TaxID=2509675 RepID=A0A4P6JVA0_KTERU|nr:ester cyclase [Ktedonosporobacter rubrisoli]QBD79293.1 ester cyclase [Ktedonosporobacter rubrisoli]
MSSEENKNLIIRFMEQVWNEHRLDLLAEFLAPDYYDYTYEPGNRAGLENTLQMMQKTFPGHQTIIEEIASEGDIVAICQTLRGTQSAPFRGHPATGKTFEIGGYRFFKLKDGKISSHRGLIDLPALLRQIGANG